MREFSIDVVPTSGETNTRKIEVEEGGTSLKKLLKAAKLNLKKMTCSINGKPVSDENHHIDSTDKVVFTEKVRGS